MRRSFLGTVVLPAFLVTSCQGPSNRAIHDERDENGEIVRVEKEEDAGVDQSVLDARMGSYRASRLAADAAPAARDDSTLTEADEVAADKADEAEEAIDDALLASRVAAYQRLPNTVRLLGLTSDLGPADQSDPYDPFVERGCPPQGNAADLPHQKQNRLKNRVTKPHASTIDDEVTLEAMRAPGPDRDRFSPAMAATIEGYCRVAKGTGAETCNCKVKKVLYTDTHFEIVSGPNDHGQPVIAEVTPVWRLIHRHYGLEDWSSSKLKDKYEGKRVRITGWLFFDESHVSEADNTHPHGADNWRATCWEIHPITSIEVVK